MKSKSTGDPIDKEAEVLVASARYLVKMWFQLTNMDINKQIISRGKSLSS